MTEPARVEPETSDLLQMQVGKVAEARHLYQDALQSVMAARERFDQEHMAELQQLVDTKGQMTEEETRLRELAVVQYERTGEKKPAPGVSIREKIEVDYPILAAVDWCRTHDEGRDVLELSKSKFNKVASVLNLPFVTKRVVPQATLAKDMDAAIADAFWRGPDAAQGGVK